MILGNKLIGLRKENKMTQEEIADKLGVTRQTVSNWELNQTKPDLDQLKEISRIYKISIDELVDNNVKEVLSEKVSNVEKLSGLIYKILKVIVALFIGFIVASILAVILFATIRKEVNTSEISSAILECIIEDNKYTISIGDDKYFNCTNCNKQMEVYLRDITDWANIEHSVQNINKYFKDNGGNCD